MCSLNNYKCNGNDNEITEYVKDPLADATLCRKCKSKNIDILLASQSGYCKTCFLIVANHKFKATLGKSKIIHHNDSILVSHSGELNSTVLLYLIKTGMGKSVHKKFTFNTTILYIDDGAVIEKTDEDRKILQSKIVEQTKHFGFNGYIVSLSQVLNKEDVVDIRAIDCQLINNEDDKQLCEILAKLPDDTSRIDLLYHLRQKLLISAARKLNCNKIFVADCATDIATKVLGDICLGRGTQLSTLATFCDTRFPDVKILKPMRDFTRQELTYFSECHQLNPVKPEAIDVTAQLATSIQTLAQNFTTRLELQFSGTTSTIFRTAEKLSARNNEHQELEDNCVLCNAQLDSTSLDDELSATRAIEISKLVSSKFIEARTPFNERKENKETNCTSPWPNNRTCNNDDSCNCKDKKRQINSVDIQRCLCYSCKLIFRNSNILCTMPSSLLSTVQRKLALRNMREEINDFLI